jgi:tetratricopeptide (TPR) repeat protein
MQLGPHSGAEQAIEFALAARDKGCPAEGLGPLQAALQREPRNARLWQTLGGVHRALEDSAAAISAYERAAACAPGDTRALHGIAQASLEAGRPAVAMFDRACTASPGDGALIIGRAAAQLAQGEGAQAIADLDAVTANNPLWLEGHRTLARLRWQLGERGLFAASLTRALASHPRSAELWIALAQLLVEVDAFADAAAVIERAGGMIGEHGQLTLIAAQCASELGFLDRADQLFARMGAAEDVALIEQRARHLLRRQQPDLAAALIEPWLGKPSGQRLWPYAAITWRATGDSRFDWLNRPELVAVDELPIASRLEALASDLRSRHRAIEAPAGQSVRGGTQTDGPLFALEAPAIRELRRDIISAVKRHLARIGPADPAHPTLRHVGKPFRFAGSWSVRLTGAGHHRAHIHPQGWFSSALYVSVPTPAEMGAAPSGWLQLGEAPTAINLALGPSVELEPVPGRLVLFPSWMWHGTRPIQQGERLTVAFDVAACG